MSSFRHVRTLLAVTEASSIDVVGRSHLVLPSDGDSTSDHQQRYAVFVSTQTFTSSEDGTDNAVLVGLESSPDGQHWVDIQLHPPTKSGVTANGLYEIGAVGPYLRAKTTLVGESSPAHTAQIVLASNAPFRLKRTP